MIKRHGKRLLLNFVAVALLTAAYERTGTPATMADAARAYLNSLTAVQRASTKLPFEGEERMNWHFIPLDNRKGVALREMTPAQKHLAEALLSAGLSQQGMIKAHTIMSLEQILKDQEKGTAQERDPEKYFVSIFGEPSETGTWGYRFEGHHISLNFAVVNGRVASNPSFFGANPAEVNPGSAQEGPRTGLRALKREEDLGRELLQSLTDAQRATAIVDKKAYDDIITSDSRQAAHFSQGHFSQGHFSQGMLSGQPNGLPFAPGVFQWS